MKPPPPNALVNKVLALTLLLLVFAGSLGLGAVWVRQDIFQTANRSRALRTQLADIERRLDEMNAEVASALNPAALMRLNETMRLGLVSPREMQVVRVAGSPELRLAAKRSREAFTLATATGEFSFRVVNASYTR